MAKYALPCACGKEVLVDAVQAGQQVACSCGRPIDVPRLRDLGRLATRQQAPATTSQGGWGFAHGLLIVAAAVALAGLAWGGYAFYQFHQIGQFPPRLEYYPPGQVWWAWQDLRRGVEGPLGPDQMAYAQARQKMAVRTAAGGIAAFAGLIGIAVAAYLLLRNRPFPPPPS